MEKNHKAVSPTGAARKILELLKLDKKDVSSIYAFAILAGILSLAMPLGIQTIIGFVLAGSISTSIVILIVNFIFYLKDRLFTLIFSTDNFLMLYSVFIFLS